MQPPINCHIIITYFNKSHIKLKILKFKIKNKNKTKMSRISETEKGFKLINRGAGKRRTNRDESMIPTFAMDDHLPRLTVPPLNKTLNKYLESLKPFLTDLEYLNTEKKVENFRNGVGKVLQFHLKAKAKCEKNWVYTFFRFEIRIEYVYNVYVNV